MIVGLIGPPRSGKTACMVLHALLDLKEKNRRIYANFPIKTDRPEDFILLTNSNFKENIDRTHTKNTLLLDEIGQNTAARGINTIDLEQVISQAFKYLTESSDLLYGSQVLGWVPPMLYDITDVFIRCSTTRADDDAATYIETNLTFLAGDPFKFERFVQIDDVDIPLNKVMPDLFERYDTYQDVPPMAHDYGGVKSKYADDQVDENGIPFGRYSRKDLTARLLEDRAARSVSEAERVVRMIRGPGSAARRRGAA